MVDDHVAFAEALASRLDAEPGLSACEATSLGQARGVLTGCRVDVMLLDAEAGGREDFRFAAQACSRDPDMRVVILATGDEEDQVTAAVRAGVSGWVPKDEPFEHLLSVVRGSLSGETWIPPRLLSRVLADLRSGSGTRGEQDPRFALLTHREREILGYLATGTSADAIANQLYLSRSTVRTHIQNMLRKLDVHSVLAAVALARRLGLNPPGSGRAAGRLQESG